MSKVLATTDMEINRKMAKSKAPHKEDDNDEAEIKEAVSFAFFNVIFCCFTIFYDFKS